MVFESNPCQDNGHATSFPHLVPRPVPCSESTSSNEQIRAAGQYILAEAPIESRSERYSYILAATMLQDLRGEDLEPF